MTPKDPPVHRPRRERFSAEVRRVYLFADTKKEGVRAILEDVVRDLEGRCDSLVVHRNLRKDCDALRKREIPPGELPDLLVVLGGDGSILTVVRAFQERPVPTIGVNLGRIGFLASVRADGWRAAMDEVVSGQCVLEPRMRLSCEMHMEEESRKATAVALNDLLVQRGAAQGMMTLSLHDSGSWVSDYRADGLIISSPSGSTAHSLAAGGPILAPSMRGLVVTPMSPQSLSHRPMVMHPNSILEIGVVAAHGLVTVAVDGHGFYPMRQGDRVVVRQHPEPYPLLARPESDPYLRVRERLGWRGTFEPEPDMDFHDAPTTQSAPGEGEVL